MIGAVVAMEPHLYQQWLSQRSPDGSTVSRIPAEPEPGSMAASGAELFQTLGCNSCHRLEGGGTAPSLVGVYGSEVTLTNGQTVVADVSYLRTSIFEPQAQVVAGYPPIMPTYEGQIDEEQLLLLVEYIRFLGNAEDVDALDSAEPKPGEQDQAGENGNAAPGPDENDSLNEGGVELDIDDPGDLDESVQEEPETDDPSSTE
jgi:mono/diheme cytochrome c family protein